jgi:hypothetical protein
VGWEQFTETAAVASDAVPDLVGDAEAAQDERTFTDTLKDTLAVAAWPGADANDIAKTHGPKIDTTDFMK